MAWSFLMQGTSLDNKADEIAKMVRASRLAHVAGASKLVVYFSDV